MNFDELNAIVAKEAGVDICPMCGTPFRRRDGRQKTCGTDECKRLWKNKYLRERRLRLIAEDKELFNLCHAEAQRRSRHKKRAEQIARENARTAREDAKRDTISVKEVEHLESLFAMRTPADKYAEQQIAKTLAQVPKIDTSIGEKK